MEMKTNPKAVLELFTSQGCSSCPEADAALRDWSEREDVITIAYHVDYWNYIGWKDVFSAPRYSKLQRAYARAFGAQRVYTPQIIVNGTMEAVGSRRQEVENFLAEADLNLQVDLSLDQSNLTIELKSDGTMEADATIWVIPYISEAQTKIKRGENSGKTLTYSHIARGRMPVGMWHGETSHQLELPLSDILVDGADGMAVLVQTKGNGGPGAILGAASIEK
ncbi:DUF1223 domain-containing protein [Maritalea mediterranea]|uniref:DUF1223 domain-containing protein n=1 Tax=Maritalea mediterranea TaxID=2909667 RepID=A0ABS9E259_9HYPH|nr:DUF1223 domain-containing protein [Maritalea mediterranea]MCF4096868.1 DUF1223 domain-containing protein [Maritalea mediterranea]